MLKGGRSFGERIFQTTHFRPVLPGDVLASGDDNWSVSLLGSRWANNPKPRRVSVHLPTFSDLGALIVLLIDMLVQFESALNFLNAFRF